MDRISRPRVAGGLNIKVKTGCGNMYVQLCWWNGQLYEVFATLGRGGGSGMASNEALTRSITASLRCGVNVDEHIDQLINIRCQNPIFYPKEDQVLSCADGVGKVLKEFGHLTTEEMVEVIMGVHGDNLSKEGKKTSWETEQEAHPGKPDLLVITNPDAEAASAMARMEEQRALREKEGLG